MATQKRFNGWTPQQLTDYSRAAAAGYLPGIEDTGATVRDEWTTQRHLQAARMRSQVFMPGF